MIRLNWERLTAPKDRRAIYDWAADNVRDLPACYTIRDPRRLRESRHLLPVWDDLKDDRVRRVVLYKPARGGGSMISDIWHVWTRANDPGPAMVILQTNDMAAEYSETRPMMLFRQCDAITPFMPESGDKMRTTSVLWNDGLPFYVNGPSIKKLQTKGLRYITLDEPWMYDPGTIAEAVGRLGDFARLEQDKLFLCSQAGNENDDLDVMWMAGHRAEWVVECMGCHRHFEPLWTHNLPDKTRRGMRWDEHKDERGFWKVEACLQSVRYECPFCAYPHMDTEITKGNWNRTGRYQPHNDNAARSIRSYRWRAQITDPWAALVTEFLTAMNARKMGVFDQLITFWQKRQAEPKSEATLMEGTLNFRTEQIDITTLKDEELRAMTVDRQGEDLYWVLVGSWNKLGEFRRLWYGKLFGRAALKAKADEFAVHTVAVDSGYESKGDTGVYATCINYNSEAQRWIALKGSDDEFFYHQVPKGPRIRRSWAEPAIGDPERGQSGEGQAAAILIRFSAPAMAHRVVGLIRAGLWIEPDDKDTEAGREYRRQMSAEYLKPKPDKFTGKSKLVWVCPSGNNHAFDCAKEQCALATIAGILPDIDSTPATVQP